MDGILIIDKPAGFTSHDVVARVRRILKTKRVGHTGTLDPFATGVLVVLVGKATRLAQFLDKGEKEYEAVVRFGFETDTGDRTGNPAAEDQSPKRKVEGPKPVTIEAINAVLERFRGEIEQTPPMYSAKKVGGKKLYEFARKGIDVERDPVKITIRSIEAYEIPNAKALLDPNLGLWTYDFGLKITCSAGTYIRTLAEDIGRAVGTSAHLQELRRIRAGRFAISKSMTLEELEEKKNPAANLMTMNEAVAHLPEMLVDKDRVEKTRNGLSTRVERNDLGEGQPVRMNDGDGNLIAIGFYGASEKTIRPKVVLS